MSELNDIAPAFVEMAHRIVWCSVATVDRQNRPRVRIRRTSSTAASSPATTGRRRLRVFPGTVLLGHGGEVLSWLR